MATTPLTPEFVRKHPEVLAALHAAARHERADVVSMLLRQALGDGPAALRTAHGSQGPRR